MKATAMDARGQHMLELLAEGASARVIARKLGYSEGTTRVYLHNLYRVIGVRNKTEAVIWHLNRVRRQEIRPAQPPAIQAAPASSPAAAALTVGEMALAEDLYTALGVMSSFIGPYGHVWEAGIRLKGGEIDEPALARRTQARMLWRALLRGDFVYGKRLHDEGAADRLAADAPSEAVLLACLLLIGGYSSAAQRLMVPLAEKRKGATAREVAFLKVLRDALESGAESRLAALHDLVQESARAPLLRQLAMVALFHAYRARKDGDRAQRTANALWGEAESVRQQLEAMGVRPLGRDVSPARSTKPAAKESAPAREKAAVAR